MSMKTEGARLTAFSYFVRKEYRLLAAFLILILLIVILLIEYPGKLSLYFFTSLGQSGSGSCFRISRPDNGGPYLRDRHVNRGHLCACKLPLLCFSQRQRVADRRRVPARLERGTLLRAPQWAHFAYVRIQPIIATIATSAVFYGIALFIRPIPGGSVSDIE